jgi:Tol biopolymer transport system component
MRPTQRPAWTFPERWLPLGVLTQRRANVPSVPWRAIGVLAILLVLLAAVVAFVGSRRVPDPFGPAANGVIAGARDGDIYVLDAVTGTQQLIVGGSAADVHPLFSRDGTRIAFLRLDPVDEDQATLFLVAPDGSGLRAVFGPELVKAVAWSPSGDRLAVITGERRDRALWIVRADGSQPTGPLDLGGVMPSDEVAWRPPDGAELVFNGIDDGQFGFFVAPADGSAPPRRLVAGTATELSGLQVSADGRLLAYTEFGTQFRAHVLDIVSGATTPFGSRLPDLPNPGTGPQHSGGPIFSPDGKQIVFGRYWDERAAQVNHQLWVSSASGDGTDAFAIGPPRRTRSGHDPFWYTFAPDGKSVLILGNENQGAWLAPVDRSDPKPLEVDWGLLGDPPEWQRLAR